MGDQDRAERALARAFDAHERDHDFAPFDPETLKRGPSADETQALGAPNAGSRRTPWLGLVAAAVVLVLAVPVGTLLLGRMGVDPTRAASPAAAPAPDLGAETQTGEAGEAGRSSIDTGASASAPAGWRWESMLDASVLVPASWGHGFAPGEDWCAADGHVRPDTPFVQRNPLSQATRSILCTEPMPDELRQTHLTWRHAEPGDADGTVALGPGEWLQVNRVVGSAFLTVEAPAGDVGLAEEILATARTSDVDPHGCPVRLPEGSPTTGPLAGFTDSTSGAVCQYVLDATRTDPDLVGSYALDGESARRLASEIEAQSTYADLLGEPTTCPRGEALLIRLAGESGEIREVKLVTGMGCGPFGLDDGVRMRHPSRATCADLLTGPLWQAGFDERTSGFCAPE